MASKWYDQQAKQLVTYIEAESRKIKNSEENKANVFSSKMSGFGKRIIKEQKRADNVIGRYVSNMKKFGGPTDIPTITKMAELIKKHETLFELRQANKRISSDPSLYNPIKSTNRKDLLNGTLSASRADTLLKQVKRERSKKKLGKK